MQLFEARLARYAAFATALLLVSLVALVVREEPRGRVVVTDTTTEILDVVEFEPGTAMMRPSSFAILDAVAATLHGNPSIELVEVQSHTSGLGDELTNLELTNVRAEVVRAYLVGVGVEASRLVAQGYGDTQPIERTPGSWKNERIAFLILERRSD